MGSPSREVFRGPARPERLELLAACPGPDPCPFLAEAGDERGPVQLGDRADPAQAEAGEAGTDIRIGGEEAGRMRSEEVGLAAGRDEVRGPWSGEDRGDGRAEAGAGDPGPDAAVVANAGDAAVAVGPARTLAQRMAQRPDQPLDEDRLRPPQRLEAVDLDLEQPERRVTRVDAAGDPRAERRECLEGGLDGRPVRVGVGIDEGRLRDEPMGAPERDPSPDAQRPGFPVRVDDRARIPRPAAQDERAGREGLGGSRPGELEGEVRPVEMEESHRCGSVRSGSRGLDR